MSPYVSEKWDPPNRWLPAEPGATQVLLRWRVTSWGWVPALGSVDILAREFFVVGTVPVHRVMFSGLSGSPSLAASCDKSNHLQPLSRAPA